MLKKRWWIFLLITGLTAVLYYCSPLYNSPDTSFLAASNPAGRLAAENDCEGVFPEPSKTLYIMNLYLDTSDNRLYGKTAIKTCNSSQKVLHELWFTAYPNAFKTPKETPAPGEAYYNGFSEGWIKLEQVKVNGETVEYFEHGISIQMLLPSDVLPGEELLIEMEWSEKIPALSYRYGCRDGVFMLGNFYPVLNVLGEQGWYCSYNSSFGDPFCFHCANYIVSVNVPEPYEVISTGSTVSTVVEDNGRESHLIKADNVRDFSMVIAYGYDKYEEVSEKAVVKCYTPWNHRDTAAAISRESGDILNYYSCTWGSYPYSEFKIVFVPMKGFHGMEYSGLVFISEELLSPGNSRGEEHRNYILAHEIAHQWWYGMVGNDQIREPWLDEGLASWSACRYLKDCKGIEKTQSYQESSTFLVQELKEMNSTRDYYLTAYTGGEAFWFGLQKELGQDKVNKVLRRYLAEYRYDIATSADLLKIIEIEAGKNMQEYFEAWF